MSLQTIIPWLTAALAVSVALSALGASTGSATLVALSCAGFAALSLLAGYMTNRPMWDLEPHRIRPEAVTVAARRNARLIAIAYAWGAATLLIAYPISGLRWQHAWQYGAGMAVIALAIFAYAISVTKPDSPMATSGRQLRMLHLTIVHGMLALGGLGWLILSGKLASAKSDWLANLVFLTGGVLAATLSAFAAVTQTKLKQR